MIAEYACTYLRVPSKKHTFADKVPAQDAIPTVRDRKEKETVVIKPEGRIHANLIRLCGARSTYNVNVRKNDVLLTIDGEDEKVLTLQPKIAKRINLQAWTADKKPRPSS